MTLSHPNWPSGDCKAIFATKNSTPLTIAEALKISSFRAQDDLDWFCAVLINIQGIGDVLIMKHDGNPEGLTAYYVDSKCEKKFSIEKITTHLKIEKQDLVWELPD